MGFGAEVRRLRKARGLSLEQLAEKAGLSRNYIATLETKPRDPSLTTLRSIARALQVPVSELMKEKLSSAPSPAALEVARQFDRLPQRVQDGVIALLRSLTPTDTPATPRPRSGTRRAGRS